MSQSNVGKVIQVMGAVIDIRFENDHLPALLNAIEVENGDSPERVHIRVYYTIKNSLINDYIKIDLNNE